MAHKQRVTRTPQTWLGTLAEAVTGTAGRGVIVGDRWYRFNRKRGALVATDARLADRPTLHIEDAGEASDAETRQLNAMVGARWSLIYNCATAFSPFWGSPMSAVSPSDRASVARHVVLSVIVAAAVIGASLFGADLWIERKVERIEARMDAQYRSVVTHLGQIKARRD